MYMCGPLNVGGGNKQTGRHGYARRAGANSRGGSTATDYLEDREHQSRQNTTIGRILQHLTSITYLYISQTIGIVKHSAAWLGAKNFPPWWTGLGWARITLTSTGLGWNGVCSIQSTAQSSTLGQKIARVVQTSLHQSHPGPLRIQVARSLLAQELEDSESINLISQKYRKYCRVCGSTTKIAPELYSFLEPLAAD